MMQQAKRILLIGLGRWGANHLRVLQSMPMRFDTDRWRAYLVKAPGVPTALMPFYGPTPDEAAEQLRQWLIRAHARAAESIRPV